MVPIALDLTGDATVTVEHCEYEDMGRLMAIREGRGPKLEAGDRCERHDLFERT